MASSINLKVQEVSSLRLPRGGEGCAHLPTRPPAESQKVGRRVAGSQCGPGILTMMIILDDNNTCTCSMDDIAVYLMQYVHTTV